MRILYFDCFSGLAGDMTLGALIDLGLDADRLRGALGTLDLPDWHLEVGHATKMGLRGVKIVGADLVEVSPPFDPSGGTAFLGVSIMFEMLCAIAEGLAE